MSNESKVAILAIVAVALFYWGYKFVRGKNILATSNIYFVEYDNVDQLSMSAPVLINGLQVGFVADIFLNPDDYDAVIVKLDLEKEIKVPKSTVAIIKDTGFMGGKAISLRFSEPCTGDDGCAESGTYLQGGRMGFLDAMLGEEEVEDYMGILKTGVKDVLDTLNKELLSEDAEGPLAETLRDLSATIENLKGATNQLNALMANSSDDIDGTLANLRSISDNIAANNGQINDIIGNAEKITGDLAAADLKKTMQDIEQTMAQLNSTIQSADNALTGVETAVGKINNGQGTLGKLIEDEELYNRLSSLSTEADSLITDFQERPYRYMPFKSRRKVMKYDRKDEKLEEEAAAAGSN